MNDDDRLITVGELKQLLRHLDLAGHPRTADAATVGSRRDDHMEATRTVVWDETQAADGTFLVTYDEYA